MNKEMIINKLKEKKDIFLLTQKLKNLSEVEKININKILNFTFTWWLKNIDNNLLTDIEQEHYKEFKYYLIQYLLKILLLEQKDAILCWGCDTITREPFFSLMKKTNSTFLKYNLPRFSLMTIKQDKILIEHNKENGIAFDIYKGYQTKSQRKTTKINDTWIVFPKNFIITDIDWVTIYIEKKKRPKKIITKLQQPLTDKSI